MITDKDMKAKKLVFDRYVLINDDESIDFKSELGMSIDKKLIFREDAFNIVYDLMHGVINYDFKENAVCKEFETLIERVDKYNRNNDVLLKNGALFFKDYSHEKELFDKFVSGDDLTVVKSIENGSRNYSKKRKDISKVRSENKIVSINSLEKRLEIIKKESENKIKKLIDDSTIGEATKETRKRKILDEEKRKLGSEIRKCFPDSDWRKILKFYYENGSITEFKDEFKRYISEPQIIKENNKKRIRHKKTNEKVKSKQTNVNLNRNKFKPSKKHETVKINANQIKSGDSKKSEIGKENNKHKDEIFSSLKKMKIFNNKTLYEMFLSKDEYSKVLEISKNDFFKHFKDNPDVINFSYFFDNLDEIENAVKLTKKIKENESDLNEFFKKIDEIGYLSNSYRVKLLDNFLSFYQLVIPVKSCSNLIKNKIFQEFKTLKRFIEFYEDLEEYDNSDKLNNNHVKAFNENYMKMEMKKYPDLFNDIFDENKRRAIVCDEDNVKVVAGAGAGKTFIIEKRIEYLINKRNADSEKILCLCYTKKAANQLEDKIKKYSRNVKVFTFHEFCRRVIRDCNEIKRSNRYLLDGIIRKYVGSIVQNPKRLSQLSEYFSYYSAPQIFKEKFFSLEEYEDYCENNRIVSLKKKYYQCEDGIETIKGESVKSLGELLIANYLFMHEIEYVYEKKYPHNYYADMIYHRFFYSGSYFNLNQIAECSNEDLINKFLDREYERINSKPDFYLPKYDLYLEHFGVDKNMEASFLIGSDKEKYEMSMNSKKVFHKLYGTNLICTYYFYLTEGRLLTELERCLRDNGVEIGQLDQEKLVETLINNSRINDFENFTKLVKSFINIYESKNQNKADFNEFRKNNNSKDIYTFNRQALFLDIVEEIYNEYYEENMKGDLSHNHEILNALRLIQDKKFNKNYNYIFIDEYQDINPIRCQLIKELQKNSSSKLFVVGDDWQSIYGFAGSEVELFKDFDKFFKNPEIITIKENRRNPQKLIDITSEFMKKINPNDKRELKYFKEVSNPNPNPIQIVKYNKESRRFKILKLDAVIDYIVEKSEKAYPKILILGRNKSDIDDYVGNILFIEKDIGKMKKIIYSQNPKLDIYFMTVHQAKGLQCDEVIVLNLENKLDGFPNKMEDDPILSFVKTTKDMNFSEERRLLYVALTRTKNNVFLLTASGFSSIFVDELINEFNVFENNLPFRIRKKYLYEDNDFFEKIVEFPTNIKCPDCDRGVITVILNNYNSEGKRTKYVRCSKRCGYDGGPYPASLADVDYIEKCPKCRGVLVRQGDILRCCLNYHEGCAETKELNLEKKDLEFDYD